MSVAIASNHGSGKPHGVETDRMTDLVMDEVDVCRRFAPYVPLSHAQRTRL